MAPSSSGFSLALSFAFFGGSLCLDSSVNMSGQRIAHAAYKGPSVVKEIIYGMAIGLAAGGLWKMHHWNNQRRTKEFYDLLDKGEISVVVEDE
ncbi:hypothetical protein L6164_005096 [Bauhinia variegata]|uniref:Uncharacterized protein n=1 Tax=Bauhinia variegata TaxID=167791 RepID=A0ACB9PQ82_BAUVA|nr:hypothetical protein L6164_005096 [Bauhinia variegata]